MRLLQPTLTHNFTLTLSVTVPLFLNSYYLEAPLPYCSAICFDKRLAIRFVPLAIHEFLPCLEQPFSPLIPTPTRTLTLSVTLTLTLTQVPWYGNSTSISGTTGAS